MKAKVGTALMVLGALLLAAALGLFLYNRNESEQAAEAVEAVLPQIVAATEQAAASNKANTADDANTADTDENEMPAYAWEGLDYVAVLELPTLGLTLPILDEWSYPNLKKAPCRYTGSARTNDLVIAAHNYARHFGYLTRLSIGDKVTLTDMDGVQYIYEVAKVETLEPTDVEKMTTSGYALTLFTCTYGGKSRVTVRCDLVDRIMSDATE